jgi:MFS family permease
MSVALIPMARDLGWSTADRGLVSSAFFWGYAATQVPAGYIATRVGGAKVLLAGVILWSIGMLPLATSSKLYELTLGVWGSSNALQGGVQAEELVPRAVFVAFVGICYC